MKAKIYSVAKLVGVVGGLMLGASSAFAVDAHMFVVNVSGLATSTLSDFGTQVLALFWATNNKGNEF